ncbi:ATP-binding protein [Pseudomonas sp. PDM05]|uniref:HD domain-containing protein n=1 Tax=Pseudomonas sp. PDM05 TaxID=2769301 RepID=UPI00177D6469|nr:ATP-binding protein [Pseudomonas sp. PDM05]MBD9461181.1 ATP-binding protein [Pseudomonas sp. PDM05]
MELSGTIQKSHLWKNCFEVESEYPANRDRLKQSFLHFRERAAQLATEIRLDLPELTIHDITHLDALWETASQICGSAYNLTPTETYVLGGAILLHDLAMSVAATPGGIEALRKTQRWSDIINNKYQSREKRPPTPQELETPSPDIYKEAIFEILRKIHAESAEKLAFTSFEHKKNNLFLIEDAELRLAYGRIIGEIAHSHWWSVAEIETRFKETIGTPPWATATDWTVNPLKIACILRAADAAHLDSRRAPIFIRSFRKLNQVSEMHWDFQEKLLKPYLKDDALIFTSGQSFPFAEATSWWVCLETLKMVDHELRSIDALLSDLNLPRFSAKRVAGIDQPSRLAKYIRTENWHPVNATIQITDIPSIIKSVGGQELYGARPTVPVRELIQNASDAIKARRAYEKQEDLFGEIKVSITKEDERYWLHISDNGTGMSEFVLTNYLLDFGKSFWASSNAQEEFPGLASSNFEPTGKYGIGFFSAFMIADKLTITTRHVDKAKSDTIVLEFGCGLHERPILRPANQSEYIRDGGTTISLRLTTNPEEDGGILYSKTREKLLSLAELCLCLAPSIDVNLTTTEYNKYQTKVITANDWESANSSDLTQRLASICHLTRAKYQSHKEYDTSIHKNLRSIYENGILLGRACISTDTTEHSQILGQLTVGGLDSNYIRGVTGVLKGKAIKASRDTSEFLASKESFAQWATEQAPLIKEFYSTEEQQAACASTISMFGGDTGELPLAIYNGEWKSKKELENLPKPEQVIFTYEHQLHNSIRNLKDVNLTENILLIEHSYYHDLIGTRGSQYFGTSSPFFNKNYDTHINVIFKAISKAWSLDAKTLLQKFYKDQREDIAIGTSSTGEILCYGVLITP